MSQNIAWIHVEMPEQASVTEEGGALVAAPSTPLWVVDAAEVAEAAGGCVLRPHEVIDRCTQCFLPVSGRRSFRLEAHDLAGAVEDLRAVRLWDNLGPCVAIGVLTGAAV